MSKDNLQTKPIEEVVNKVETTSSVSKLGATKPKDKSLVDDKRFDLKKTILTFKGNRQKEQTVHLNSKYFNNGDDKDYLIIGFDTEYCRKNKDLVPTYQTIKDSYDYKKTTKANPMGSPIEHRHRQLKNTILSYQYYVTNRDRTALFDGIIYINDDKRLSIQEFIFIILGDGILEHNLSNIPNKIYLVGHFTRADIPSFSNFVDMTKYINSIRSSFVTLDKQNGIVKIELPTVDDSFQQIDIMIRDTMILSPASKHKLQDLGELVGIRKHKIEDKLDEQGNVIKDFYIKNMDIYMKDYPIEFEKYGIRDAEICVKYLQTIMDRFKKETEEESVPLTLSGIGVTTLLKVWKDEEIDSMYVLGKEPHKVMNFNKAEGRYKPYIRETWLPDVFHDLEFVTESFHGGRNEQFWYGIGFEDDWFDLDLANAYPTAMSLIGYPQWKESKVFQNLTVEGLLSNYSEEYLRNTHNKNLKDPDILNHIHRPQYFRQGESFTKDLTSLDELMKNVSFQSLSYFWIDFKFSEEVRYPCLPVRTNNGIIFPLEGTTYVSSPELLTAYSLGCDIKVKRGVLIPTDNSNCIFQPFVIKCIEERKKYAKDTIDNLFWKELVNSTYGKTAQGLREKRLYDLRTRDMKVLPPSKITNPYFASYITSFVRATLACIMNSIPKDKMIFSVTTDGFLGNISIEDIKKYAWDKPLIKMLRSKRQELTGLDDVLEIKHHIRKPLGWKTRGQATLIEGTKQDEGIKDVVLAKSGIKTTVGMEEDKAENREILNYYFTREYSTLLTQERGVGPKHMMDYNLDFTRYEVSKGLNMEFDWKRIPSSVTESEIDEYNLAPIAFHTKPIQNKEQFEDLRLLNYQWNRSYFNKEIKEDKLKEPPENNFYCYTIKRKDDLDRFLDYVKLNQKGVKRVYTFKEGNELKRLRTELCIAFKHGVAGLPNNNRTNNLLTDHRKIRMWYALTSDTDKDGNPKKPMNPAEARYRIIKVTNIQFAKILNIVESKFECKPYHVNNGIKGKQFTPHRIPPTRLAVDVLYRLKAFFFDDLDIDLFLDKTLDQRPLSIKLEEDYFTRLVK